MTDRPLISIVSPVYGCRDCLHALADVVGRAFEGCDFDWELVLVDDRAPDQPWSVIAELAARDQRIRGVRLTRNHGQHLAIWAGLEAARGDWVAVIDCDLQDDPGIIPALRERALLEGADAVVVDRGDWSDTGLRRRTSRLFYQTMDMLTKIRLNNNIGNFGLYSRRLVDILLTFHDKEVFLPVMVSLTGLPQVTYMLDRSGRHAGKSSYNLMRLMRMAVAIIIRFSDRPLKLSIIIGLTFSSFAALCTVLILLAWATGAFTVPGWTSLILSLWFLAGLILAVLGVHGFYIGGSSPRCRIGHAFL
ncbi:glycosyltransferase family 2 protein [Microvirga arabica]|uniref:glycosyltransferase family 2 protein n=1 Tax=Microvirga arabica TaxID=1128671 RepID=UPI003606DA4E